MLENLVNFKKDITHKLSLIGSMVWKTTDLQLFSMVWVVWGTQGSPEELCFVLQKENSSHHSNHF